MTRKIGIVCCSDGFNRAYEGEIEELHRILADMGIESVISPFLYARDGVASGTAEERAKAVMDFYLDDTIDAICDISGGDIANGILPYLDYSVIAKMDKQFWGYSDLTTVLNAIYAKTGQVTITMPKAEVLSCQVDQTSLNEDSYYTTREGLGAEKINADDQTEAIKTAQENMLENVQSDESLLQQAQQRAQELLEQYVKNVGDAMGKTYEVSFVIADEAGTNTVSTDESDN